MTTPTTVEKKLLRITDVLETTSMSRSTLWRLVKTGQFPAPLKVGGPNGRAVRWLREDIEEWIADLQRICSV